MSKNRKTAIIKFESISEGISTDSVILLFLLKAKGVIDSMESNENRDKWHQTIFVLPQRFILGRPSRIHDISADITNTVGGLI